MSRTSHLNTLQRFRLSQADSVKVLETPFKVIAIHAAASLYRCHCILDDFDNFIHSLVKSFANMKSAWCTSVLAGCFHFTLPHRCCPFFLEKVCLVANGPRYILSALWQRNFKAISWQISSNGAFMVIAQAIYISPQIAVPLVHCFPFTSLPSVSGSSVNIQQDWNIHTLQCHITMHQCHASSTQQCTWTYLPRQRWVHMAELVHKAVCWISSKLESMKIIRSFDHMV